MARTSNGTPKRTKVGDMIANGPDSHAEIAAKLGVDASLVTRWKSGTRKPTAAQMAKLEKLYGSPVEELPPPPSLDDDDDDDDDNDPEEGNNARLRRFIRNGIEELEHDSQLSGVKRAEALKKLVDAQIALDKSTGENALTTARIVAHPEFKRVVRLITEAIAPCPACLQAAIDVLEKVRG